MHPLWFYKRQHDSRVRSNVSGDGFNGGSDPYLQFRDTHSPCLLKLYIPPSNGIVRWWLFPEFGAELPLDSCTPTVILNNPVYGAQEVTRRFTVLNTQGLCHSRLCSDSYIFKIRVIRNVTPCWLAYIRLVLRNRIISTFKSKRSKSTLS